MKEQNYLKVLVEDIHSVVIATVDKNGLPFSRVIDMMLYDENGIYFLTAHGKVFFEQLQYKPYISLSGITTGADTMRRKSISLSGAVRNIGSMRRDEIFEKNPYMNDIYLSDASRIALDVFCLYKGNGDFFDLSTKPITRRQFSFGGESLKRYGYQITNDCNSCGLCQTKCPQDCILSGTPFKIVQENCLHCGNCFEICPIDAIEKLG